MIETILEQSEQTWRNIIRIEHPLFADIPVINAKQDKKNKRHWMFYTNLKEIHMDVFKPEEIEKAFLKRIIEIYESAYGKNIPKKEELEEMLHHDNFTYLHFHELFHPVFCPDSKEDEKLVDKAIYEACLKSGFSEVQSLAKTGNARNSVWDYVIDTAFFYFSNFGNSLEKRLSKSLEKRKGHDGEDITENVPKLPDGVVTIFDTVEYEMAVEPMKSLFYPLTRSIYGLTMCKTAETRKKVFDKLSSVLKKPMNGQEREVIIKAFQGLVSELNSEQLKFAGIDRKDFENKIIQIYDNYSNLSVDKIHNETIEKIAELLLDKKTRYDCIKGFIQPLAKYISLDEEEKRHGTHIGNGTGSENGQPQPGQAQPGEGQGQGQGQPGGQGNQPAQTGQNQPGGNTEQAMLNLADLLTQNQASALLQQVANGQMPGGKTGGKALQDKRLQNLARDEYYKKNVEEALVRSPKMEAEGVELGKIKRPILISSMNLRPEELVNIDLEKILEFQQETGITQLFQISDFEYRYDVYEWQEIEEMDYKYEPKGIELPENIVFHVDSSGSMGHANYVGTKSSYDTLMHVCYSILKTMKKAAKENKKKVNVISANFSNGTVVSPKSFDIQEMYDTPNNEVKTVLMGFQGGGTVYSPQAFAEIKKLQKPGKTVHIWVSDGGLESNSEYQALQKIEDITREKETSFVYFEIGSSSSFGKQIKTLESRKANVKAYPNVTIDQIQSKSLEVMIKYD